MLLHNINETQLKVANNVVGIQYKPELVDSDDEAYGGVGCDGVDVVDSGGVKPVA